jgi:hypothetical protein
MLPFVQKADLFQVERVPRTIRHLIRLRQLSRHAIQDETGRLFS